MAGKTYVFLEKVVSFLGYTYKKTKHKITTQEEHPIHHFPC